MKDRVNLHERVYAELKKKPVKEVTNTGTSLKIEIDTNNAAFEDDPWGECKRVLQGIMSKDLGPGGSFSLRDSNGNTIGDVRWR